MAPDWMNWDGWRWISLIFTAVVFFYFGWDARRYRERTHAYLEYRGPKYVLVEQLARMKDPRDCPSIDDEIEAFAKTIRTAKLLCGDLSEDEAHPDDQ